MEKLLNDGIYTASKNKIEKNLEGDITINGRNETVKFEWA